MSLFSKIRGTIETIFQIGLAGPQIKNNAGAIELRDSADAAFVVTRVATPVGVNDAATKAYVDAGGVSGAVQEVRFAVALVTVSSATSLPNNALVISAELDVTTPYSGGATISIGNAGAPTALQLTTDNNPQANGIYQVQQDSTWAGPAIIRATVAGAPGAGVAAVIVRYVAVPQT